MNLNSLFGNLDIIIMNYMTFSYSNCVTFGNTPSKLNYFIILYIYTCCFKVYYQGIYCFKSILAGCLYFNILSNHCLILLLYFLHNFFLATTSTSWCIFFFSFWRILFLRLFCFIIFYFLFFWTFFAFNLLCIFFFRIICIIRFFWALTWGSFKTFRFWRILLFCLFILYLFIFWIR